MDASRDGNIELTNDRVERELRKLVLGRLYGSSPGKISAEDGLRPFGQSSPPAAPYGVNRRAYFHRVATLIINRWPNAKLRELLPDRLAVAHPESLLQDCPLLGPTATAT